MLRFFFVENFDLGKLFRKEKIDIFFEIFRNFQSFENPR